MIDLERFDTFWQQFGDLRNVVEESHSRTVCENPDKLFEQYVNVFIKSYVVSACSILEAFIQELALAYLQVLYENLSHANLPKNIILWSVTSKKEEKLKGASFESFSLLITKDELNDSISGNIFKTMKTFEKMGVNLDADDEFSEFKDFVSSIVEKRNSIVHHNDDASDLSLKDVSNIIDEFVRYSQVLQRIVRTNQHLYRVEDDFSAP